MDYRCRLVRQFTQFQGVATPRDGKPGLLYSFVPALLFSILTPLFLPSYSVSLSYIIIVVPMRECLGKHVYHIYHIFIVCVLCFK